MVMKHWWNDTDMGNCSTQIKTCPVALCSSQVSEIDYCHVYIYFNLLFSLFNDLYIQGGPKEGILYTIYCITTFGPRCIFSCMYFYGSTAVVGLGLLIVDVSRSHSGILHSLGLIRTSDWPVTEIST